MIILRASNFLNKTLHKTGIKVRKLESMVTENEKRQELDSWLSARDSEEDVSWASMVTESEKRQELDSWLSARDSEEDVSWAY